MLLNCTLKNGYNGKLHAMCIYHDKKCKNRQKAKNQTNRKSNQARHHGIQACIDQHPTHSCDHILLTPPTAPSPQDSVCGHSPPGLWHGISSPGSPFHLFSPPSPSSPPHSAGKFIFLFLKKLLNDSFQREGERKRETSVWCSTYPCIHWLILVLPCPEIKPTTSVYGADTQTNQAPWLGLFFL